jgi:hypothetical protein
MDFFDFLRSGKVEIDDGAVRKSALLGSSSTTVATSMSEIVDADYDAGGEADHRG